MIEQRISIEAISSKAIKIAYLAMFLLSLFVMKPVFDGARSFYQAYTVAMGCTHDPV